MSDALLPPYVALRSLVVVTTGRLQRDERGEGVISAAIAVLIMAFLGAAMWVAFKGMFDSTTTSTTTKVGEIGS
jgi:hypothetical protein